MLECPDSCSIQIDECSVQRDDSFAGDLDFTLGVDALDGDAQARFTIGLEALDHIARQARLVVHLRDVDKARAKFTDARLADPFSDQPTDIGGRQHAVGEYVIQTDFAREVEIDVDRVVVARRASVVRNIGDGVFIVCCCRRCPTGPSLLRCRSDRPTFDKMLERSMFIHHADRFTSQIGEPPGLRPSRSAPGDLAYALGRGWITLHALEG